LFDAFVPNGSFRHVRGRLNLRELKPRLEIYRQHRYGPASREIRLFPFPGQSRQLLRDRWIVIRHLPSDPPYKHCNVIGFPLESKSGKVDEISVN